MSVGGWEKCKIGELCESISITHKLKKGQLIFLNTGDIERGKFLHRVYSDISRMLRIKSLRRVVSRRWKLNFVDWWCHELPTI